jgi:hypothetical protein
MQIIDRTQSYACAFFAGAALLAALALAALGEAFAACGGSVTTSAAGTHPLSAGTGGTHSGSTPSAGSASGAISCGVNASKTSTGGAASVVWSHRRFRPCPARVVRPRRWNSPGSPRPAAIVPSCR